MLASPEQALVTLRNPTRDSSDLLRPLLEALSQLVEGQDPHQARRQLQTKRKASDEGTYLPDGSQGILGREAGHGTPSPFLEEPHGSAFRRMGVLG